MRKPALVVAMLVLIVGAAWLLSRCSPQRARQNNTPSSSLSAGKKERTAPLQSAGDPSHLQSVSDAPRRKLADVFNRLQQSAANNERDDASLQPLLEKTMRYFLDLPSDEAARAVLQELESREDVPTGMAFQPSEDGLEGWPTWRVYLLDLLGSIDPKTAAEYARREIFVRYDSADEWAIAMRSVLAAAPAAQHDQAAREVSSLLARMLAQDAWRATPTDGVFEAADFIAHTPDPAVHLATLQRWAADETDGSVNATLQIAAERSASTQDGRLLVALASDPSLLASTPAQRSLRASVMARADLGRAPQVEAVRSYLLRLQPDSEEAAAFFALFPNHRFSVSPGLAGAPVLPTANEMRAADQASMRQMAIWRNDPALGSYAPYLEILEEKIRRMLQP